MRFISLASILLFTLSACGFFTGQTTEPQDPPTNIVEPIEPPSAPTARIVSRPQFSDARRAIVREILPEASREDIDAILADFSDLSDDELRAIVAIENSTVEEQAIVMADAVVQSTPSVEQADSTDVKVFYATNRADAAPEDIDPKIPASIYSDERRNPSEVELDMGVATVSIPRDHKLGQLESPNWAFRKLFGEDETKHVILQNIEVLDAQEVSRLISEELWFETDTLAFIHGYNTSFEKAARRTAQLKYDLSFSGPTMFFSWPSQNTTALYTYDETEARWSVAHVTEFLKFITSQNNDRVILIAHSMGTRLLSNALVDFIADDPVAAEKIKTIILAAPDIDAGTFKNRLLPRFRELQDRVTIYASKADAALDASKKVHGQTRLGDSNVITELPNAELVDASGLKSDFFGHTYFGDNSSIISDMTELLFMNLNADERSLLAKETLNDQSFYWKVKEEVLEKLALAEQCKKDPDFSDECAELEE